MTITLNGTTGITDVNGTAAAPAITGTDTDSGMYFGTNTVSLATGGTAAVTVDSSQNVAITGITTVAAGSAALPAIVSTTGTADTGLWFPAADTVAFSTAGTERARIDSSGNLLVNTTSALSVGTLSVKAKTGTQAIAAQSENSSTAIAVSNTSGTANYNALVVYNNTLFGTIVGSINCSGSTTNFNTSSDYRLKENLVSLVGAKDFILSLKPKQGIWKVDGSKFAGFVAHEFAEISPTSVNGEKDAVDSDGKPIYQGMQAATSEVMANLIAFVQEQQALITSLTARIEALEAR